MGNADELSINHGDLEVPGNRGLSGRITSALGPTVDPAQKVGASGRFSKLIRLIGTGVSRPLFLALLVNAGLFAGFFALATPAYETNDDLAMQLIASGFYTGAPSEFLVFTHVAIGWLLRTLYHLGAGWNWYFLYLVAAHYVALTAIGYVVIRRRRGWLPVALYVGFFLIAEIHILLRLQFTTTAFLAGAAGLMLLVDSLAPGRSVRWLQTIAGAGLIALMIMIRAEVALFLAMVAVPFLLERFGWKGWRRLAGLGLTGAALFVALRGIDHWYYDRDPGWRTFREYNQLRGEVYGTPLTRNASRAASAAGWSENDATMFAKSFFPDAAVYADLPRLRRFVVALKGYDNRNPILNRFSWDRLHLASVLGRDSGILLNLALLNGLWCWFAAGANRRRCLVTLTAYYGLFVALAFYLQTTARLPPRVAYNLPLFLNLVCLYWATGFDRRTHGQRDQSAPNAPRSRWWGLPILVWGALYASILFNLGQCLWYADARHRELRQISQKLFDPIKALLPAGTKPILITLPHDAVWEQCLIYRDLGAAAPFDLLPYGWLTHSPLFREVLRRRGLKPYSLSVVDRPERLLPDEPHLAGILAGFLPGTLRTSGPICEGREHRRDAALPRLPNAALPGAFPRRNTEENVGGDNVTISFQRGRQSRE